MHLGQHRHPALGEAVDQVQLPQRMGSIERPREDPRDRLGQLAVVARRRHRALTDVEVDVEVGVVDPVGVIEPERHLDELAPERRQQVQPAADDPADVRDLDGASRGRRGVEDREAAHVPVGAR
jgi:hypothetical protein